MKRKKQYYVVWQGKKTGIFNSWDECKRQVEGVKGAQYMGFYTLDEAKMALEKTYDFFKGQKGKKKKLTDKEIERYGKPIGEAIAVDAAFNGKTKMLEYQGVFVETSTLLFHFGPIKGGTNNIGEFLAIVHAMAYEQKNNFRYPIYSDSKTALSWIRRKKCNTKIDKSRENVKIVELISRAEKWLLENDISDFELLKWQTEAWGEIPADFGRK
jgi:ribonuclease HI